MQQRAGGERDKADAEAESQGGDRDRDQGQQRAALFDVPIGVGGRLVARIDCRATARRRVGGARPPAEDDDDDRAERDVVDDVAGEQRPRRTSRTPRAVTAWRTIAPEHVEGREVS